jgi:hypothetical protein
VAETAVEKSGGTALTVKEKVWVFAAGAPLTFAARVTVTGPPKAVVGLAVTVMVTVVGFEAVGVTELEGAKTHAVPLGRPLGQLRLTVPENDPEADTWNVAELETPLCATVSALGLGADKLKSTMCRVTASSCVIA